MRGSTLSPLLCMLVCLSSSQLGCDGGGETRSVTASESSFFAHKTTRGDVAVTNLNSQVSAREFALTLRPNDGESRSALVELLLTRTQYLGAYADFDRAFEIVDEWNPTASTLDDYHLTQAKLLSAVHRFDEARAVLAEIDNNPPGKTELMETIDLAQGRNLTQVQEARRAALLGRRSFQNLVGLAAVEAALGSYEIADSLYQEALDGYGDVSPLPVAWTLFQRGVMWAEAADQSERAIPLYREAAARLPSYVVANVHLAELEAEQGEVELAIARLRHQLAHTQDPEPAGLLGELLADSAPSESAALIAEARAQYDSLLVRHREAFSDHGAEFFIGPGANPRRALKLALGNLVNRGSDRALQVAIDVAYEAEQSDLACELATDFEAPRRSTVLQNLVMAVGNDC